MKNINRFLHIFLLSLVISACGGGDDTPKLIPLPEKAPISSDNILSEFDLTNISYKRATSQFTLHSLISDNVVFQQNKEIRIFGQAEAGTIIAVRLSNDANDAVSHETSAIVPQSGEWEVILPSQQASYDSYTLTIANGKHQTMITNCLIGEVWIVSGQSNMELKVKEMDGGQNTMAAANNKFVRIFYQKSQQNNASFPDKPQYDVKEGHWKVADSGENIEDSSAVGYVFAKSTVDMFKQRGEDVPVAIINAHKGGSKIQSWLPSLNVRNDASFSQYVTNQGFAPDQSNWNNKSWDNYNQVSALFNSKLAPLTQFNINGVVWYQGESDPVYEPNVFAIKSLINTWSELFNRSNELLNFALIQLHPFDGVDPLIGASTKNYEFSGFASHRRAQFDVAQDTSYSDNVLIVPIHDFDLKWDVPLSQFAYKDPVHPVSKIPVGERLSQMVVNNYYLQNNEYNAPMYKLLEIESENITITFDNVGDGLLLLGDVTNGVTTVEVTNSIGQRQLVSATIISNDQIKLTDIDTAGIKQVSYSNLTRNEASNLASGNGIPAIPFVIEIDVDTNTGPSELTIFSDEITDWKLPTTVTGITETVVDDQDTSYGKVIEYTYIANQVVSDLKSNYVLNLSAFQGGTLSFDFKLIKQPDTDPSAQWFIKIDCGWPCGTGDVSLTNSNEGVQPVVDQWQHYTFDIDYLINLPGGVESNATPLNIKAVTSPLVIFPAWGSSQSGAVFRLDNIIYSQATIEE